MKQRYENQEPRVGRKSKWEEESTPVRYKIKLKSRQRCICSCKKGDLYVDIRNNFQNGDDCSDELACFKIRIDMYIYGGG